MNDIPLEKSKFKEEFLKLNNDVFKVKYKNPLIFLGRWGEKEKRKERREERREKRKERREEKRREK